jgi:prepilin-type N-terminal cleavage/methylation domain-containing protein
MNWQPHNRATQRGPQWLRARGFTLMELLLAVLIFAVVLAAIQSVFFAALKLRNSTTNLVEASMPLDQTLAIIKHDLANLRMPATGGVFSGSVQSTPGLSSSSSGGGFGMSGSSQSFGGDDSGMTGSLTGGPEFYTASAIINEWSPWGEVQKVSYYLAPSTNDHQGMDLMRVVVRNLLPTVEEEYYEQFLMGGVEEMGFQYYDGLQWLDTWDSSSNESNAPPQAIKLTLQLTEEGQSRSSLGAVELVVPISLQVSTNTTTSATGG